jgi:hypothetical protein
MAFVIVTILLARKNSSKLKYSGYILQEREIIMFIGRTRKRQERGEKGKTKELAKTPSL